MILKNFTPRLRSSLALAVPPKIYSPLEWLMLNIVKEPKSAAYQAIGLPLVTTIIEDLEIAASNHGTRDYETDKMSILNAAMIVAQDMNHEYLGTEHFLLGMLKVYNGPATQIFQKNGIDLATAKIRVSSLLYGAPLSK